MTITPIVVPYDHDVAVWGCATGPQVLLEAGLLERVRDLGHPVRAPVTITLPRQTRTRDTVANLAHLGQALSLPERGDDALISGHGPSTVVEVTGP